ncbi:iron uptake transporter permease EfeU [Nocardioides terrisoli]|uniref:iron uptake transporter permease EfeU n=1 Tax=Nocardioides terrisoli TaxID=3388267 RepID=UPI00287BAEB4|nr:iron uptake transporter permease EfeU [Nocardioides marmorisolisilvae]
MLANFLIGLREGLEAALVVSILIAYLVRTGRRDRVRDVWWGAAAAVALSVGFGALLTFTSSEMSFRAQEAFGGLMSILAVGLVTWMIFWMRRTARFLKRELEGKVAAALAIGPLALVVIAFVSVAREGIETSLFIWSTTQATSGTQPFLGALLGLLTAVALGYLLYRSAVQINLATFFRYTGIGLVVVAAGVLAYGLHDLQEAGWLPGLTSTVFDVSAQVPLSSWYGALLKGAFNWNPAPTHLELTAWAAYLVVVMTAFLWPARSTAPRRVASSARV